MEDGVTRYVACTVILVNDAQRVACVDFGEELPLEKVATPHSKTIEEVANFLNVSPAQTGKAVFYSTEDGKELIFVLIRGDFEVNECKLKNVLGLNAIKFADDNLIRACGAVPGYASPVGIAEVPGKVRLVIDPSAAGTVNLVVGANEEGFHYKNFNYGRDMTGGQVASTTAATSPAAWWPTWRASARATPAP